MGKLRLRPIGHWCWHWRHDLLAGGCPALLGGLTAIFLAAACGDSAKKRASPPAAALASDVGVAPPASDRAAAQRSGSGPAEASGALGGATPEVTPPEGEPAELTDIKARVVQGDRSARMLKALQKLSYKYPKNAEIPYIIGQLYCDKLWMSDGLEYFHRAIQLDPTFRDNPYLIKAVVAGLGNDGDHVKVSRFLVQDIGPPAAPLLEEVLQGSWRKQVKDRAAATLRAIQ